MSAYTVLGGAGFVGSEVVDLLVAEGDSVTVLDTLSTCALDALGRPEFANAGAEYHAGPYEFPAPLQDGLVVTSMRWPLERERATYFAAWEGYVARSVRLVGHLLSSRVLKRIVVLASSVDPGHSGRDPVRCLEDALEGALRYWHRPPYVSVTILHVPELYGERRLTPFPLTGKEDGISVRRVAREVLTLLKGPPREDLHLDISPSTWIAPR